MARLAAENAVVASTSFAGASLHRHGPKPQVRDMLFFPLQQKCLEVGMVHISTEKVTPHCSRGRFVEGFLPAEGTWLICSSRFQILR